MSNSNPYSRKAVAERYCKEVKRGTPPPCFSPDFSGDTELYKQFGGLNEISIAMSKHQYKDIAQIRLQSVGNSDSPFNGATDDVLFDNIVPKSMCVNELVGYMRQLESDWKKDQIKDD